MSSPASPATSAALLAASSAATSAVEAISLTVTDYRELDNATLLDLSAQAARRLRLVTAEQALLAGEIAHRSHPSLGSNGLAAQRGWRTPEEMLKVTAGVTGINASKAVRVGRLLHDTQVGTSDPTTNDAPIVHEPWLESVGKALLQGLSVEAADAIRTGLRTPTDSVTSEALAAAAEELVRLAQTVDPDRLFKHARRLRDELDMEGTGDREAEMRALRSLKLYRRPDGMGRLVWDLDPETMAIVGNVYDRATSPRLGGPRFGPTELQNHASRIKADPRSTVQLASDAFTTLLQNGVTADPSVVLGTGTPAVHILVPAAVVEKRPSHGQGWLEGQPDPVGLDTIERNICTGATTEITVDGAGQPLDVGREQRLFTAKQRIALAARDGGCRWSDEYGNSACDRPPSWCEAHHVEFWKRDKGRTNINNGILLCKHHHLLLHNQHWVITATPTGFSLAAPADVDPLQTPRPMPHKSPALAAHLAAQQALTDP